MGHQKSFGEFDTGGGWGGSKGGYKACYNSHPILALGGGKFIGGSCISPAHDADVFIGLDSGMRVQAYKPWEKTVEQVLFPVTDMCAPSDSKEFKKLVEYVCNQLQQGKTVHAGCIGGHGRTGTLLAALYSVITGEKDAITKIRSIYCKKAVESSTQVDFLIKHFGITKVAGAKEGRDTFGYSGGGYSTSKATSSTSWPKSGASEIRTKPGKSLAFADSTFVWNCVNTNRTAVGKLF